MDKIYRSLGFMSGTSLDGIDCALISTDGKAHVSRHDGLSVPYPAPLKAGLKEAAYLAQHASEEVWPLSKAAEMPDEIKALERSLVDAHIAAGNMLMEKLNQSLEDVDLIGFHGHTILHRPEIGFTLQLGDGELLAQKTGVRTVSDLRMNDMAHGGQGAPLAPIYHHACVQQLIADGVLEAGDYVCVNIGGVANVTFVSEGHPLMAFDTGPGNALCDDWVMKKYGLDYDEDGKYAVSGHADKAWIKRCLAHGYFSQEPPKSIDRDLFKHFLETLEALGVSPEDGAASLAALTAKSIALAEKNFPTVPRGWIISGGGQHNPAMMTALQEEVAGQVMRSNDLGLDGDMIEAECFAYLGVRAAKDLPISFPGTTGVSAPLAGGVIHEA